MTDSMVATQFKYAIIAAVPAFVLYSQRVDIFQVIE